MRVKNVLKVVFGVLLVFAVLYYVGFGRIFTALKSFNPLYLLPMPIFIFLSYLGGVYNLYVLLSASGFKFGFWRLFKYYLLSLSAGMFTPGRLGEFSMVYFFRKEGIPLGQGAAVSFLDKLISFAAASLVAVVALFVFVIPPNLVITLAVVIVFCFLVALFFFFSARGRSLIRNYVFRSYSRNFEGFSSLLFFLLRERFAYVLLNFFVSIVKWFAIAFSAYYLFSGFGVHVSPFYIFLVTNFCAIVTLIPITFNGLGFLEMSVVFFYSRINIPSNVVVSVNLIGSVVAYLIGLAVLVSFFEEFKGIRSLFREGFKSASP